MITGVVVPMEATLGTNSWGSSGGSMPGLRHQLKKKRKEVRWCCTRIQLHSICAILEKTSYSMNLGKLVQAWHRGKNGPWITHHCYHLPWGYKKQGILNWSAEELEVRRFDWTPVPRGSDQGREINHNIQGGHHVIQGTHSFNAFSSLCREILDSAEVAFGCHKTAGRQW